MGTVRYFDGEIAVCDYGDTSADFEHTLKLLLEVDDATANADKRIQQLLASDHLFHGLWNSSPDDLGKIEDRADKLAQLGFETRDNSVPRLTQQAYDDCSQGGYYRELLVVRQEKTRILRLADALQFLARLYLLSEGDENSAFVLPRVGYDGFVLKAFDIKLPSFFFKPLQLQKLDIPVSCDLDFDSNTANVCVYGKTGRYFGDVESATISETSLKRVCAGYLLIALVNYTATLPYCLDRDSPTIIRDDSKGFTSALADSMIAGKIRACPWCGRPVLMPRKSSKPFCRPSHQTRYSEKAHAMLNDGASVDEVSETFPHIQYETIKGWLPMEGR